MFFWIVQCTRHFLVTRPILDTLRPRAGAAAAAEAAPGVPAVPKPAVPQLWIVILSGATGSQDRFKLPGATRAVTVAAGNLKRSGNLNRQADSEPPADSELKYFHTGLHRIRGPDPGYRIVSISKSPIP